jgi:hypothetical protein
MRAADQTEYIVQAYDGELAALRDLIRDLGDVVTDDGSLPEVRRLLNKHALDALAARVGDIEKADITKDVTA